MSVKIAVSLAFIVILLAITVYISSCINYVAKNYKCDLQNNTLQDQNVPSSSITVVLWTYITIEIIIFLCIGIMIGLNMSNNSHTKIPITLILFLNISKIIVFIVSISMYNNCISQLSKDKFDLLIFFCINIVTMGISESIVSCSLLKPKLHKMKNLNHDSDTDSDTDRESKFVIKEKKRQNTTTKINTIQEPLIPNANVSLITMPQSDMVAET